MGIVHCGSTFQTPKHYGTNHIHPRKPWYNYYMYQLNDETILLQLDVLTSVTVFEQQLEMFVSP